ncbi:tRNA (adenosine(37)-N6)-threonylcarbamoyltransferase complex ATPase subunit type 1 TsaE [Lewinella sp. W8]|uniref:tRNA (adenosine(37)-N6)-threonylcarbamoyltransferase complex ATPase subunit type 1 TsaE n=1 Tax=Lewinella sp. W8 TaxID=2528208 RepID=UPI0010687D6F|nr:tRNA (adenosine(37)-N6)-threonylcarbamoyltransferase complex ATPase subunit type 1 TsaE [Lewinella sp. W8]MTB50643.1 tRNA (adenosine(37)-N6)-threonylcarbamoyltransferase complex ATPase subunit type 1 TsaE [Lewinella sp. W8]
MIRRYTLEEVPAVAAELLEQFGPGRVYALEGDLGAGKTTLVAEMCRQLGVETPTSSPTFSIVNEYPAGDRTIYHMDAYRLKDIYEALDAGLEELFAEEQPTIFVEWPAVIQPILPTDVVYLRLSHAPDGGAHRELTISTGYPTPSDEQ